MTSRILATSVALLFAISVVSSAQERPKEAVSGSVAGRVLRDGKPAAGVAVMIATEGTTGEPRAVAAAVTDREGAFRLEDVPPGAYVVTANAPGLVVKNASGWGRPGRSVTVGRGEAVEGFDVELERGGVVTGRVTSVDGRPVTGEQISLFLLDAGGAKRYARAQGRAWTDDRGVYRLYGLAPGRYLVAAGMADDPNMMSFGRAKRYRLTYHPAAAVESEAQVVDVSAGGEASGVDVVLPKAERLYEASGRMVYADTGKPAAGIAVQFGPMVDGRFAGAYGIIGQSSESGAFRLTGLRPGEYGVTGSKGEGSEYFAKPVRITVTDRNVEDLVITFERGASISGTLVVDGVPPPGAAATDALSISLERIVDPAAGAPASTFGGYGKVRADGGFAVTGVEAGRYRISIGPWIAPVKPTIVRVEREGVVATAIEVTGAEPIGGVRVVAAYGTATIQGKTSAKGVEGEWRGFVAVRRVEADSVARRVQVDGRRRFVAEGLPAGRYGVKLQVFVLVPGQPARQLTSEEKIVEVGDGEGREIDLEAEAGDAQ